MALDRAEHVGLGAGAAERRAHRVDLRLGVGGATGGRDEGRRAGRMPVRALVIVKPSAELPSTVHSVAALGVLAPARLPEPSSVR